MDTSSFFPILACAAVGAVVAMCVSRVIEGGRERHHFSLVDRPRESTFWIYNYLPNKSVTIRASESTVVVPAKGAIQIPKGAALMNALSPGSNIEMTVDGKPYVTYTVDTREGERIRALHVGMVTSRFIGTATDSLHMQSQANNAVSGNAWVVMHNVTARWLRIIPQAEDYLPLNREKMIEIAPFSSFRYLGYKNSGITLGSVFRDVDGLYPEYVYLYPHSDIYWGIASDLKQPVYGCFQLEFDDACEYGQTLWPFEEGVM